MATEILIIYLLCINVFGFLIMILDKFKAKKNLYRISEKFIFLLCLAGANLGVYIAMYTVRHKTKHKAFTIGVPLLFLVNLICLYILFTYDISLLQL